MVHRGVPEADQPELKRQRALRLAAPGFTVLELTIALGLASVLALSVLSQNLEVVRQQMYYVSRSNLAQDTLLVADYFSSQLQAAGGGAVLPYMAIWVENSCGPRGPLPGCGGSDRVTISTSVNNAANPLLQCPITAQPAPNQIQGGAPGSCCFTPAFAPAQLFITAPGGASYSQVFAATLNPATCIITYIAGQASGHDALPNPLNWTGATVTPVSVATYYLDPVQHQIFRYSDSTGLGLLNATTNQELLANIFDLQAELGYDLDGTNNLVDLGSPADSWLYNFPGESWGWACSRRPCPARSRWWGSVWPWGPRPAISRPERRQEPPSSWMGRSGASRVGISGAFFSR